MSQWLVRKWPRWLVCLDLIIIRIQRSEGPKPWGQQVSLWRPEGPGGLLKSDWSCGLLSVGRRYLSIHLLSFTFIHHSDIRVSLIITYWSPLNAVSLFDCDNLYTNTDVKQKHWTFSSRALNITHVHLITQSANFWFSPPGRFPTRIQMDFKGLSDQPRLQSEGGKYILLWYKQ